MESSFFYLVRAQCEEKWPNENWEDCANMAELVGAVEERTVTWPEKWHALYEARCKAEGRAEGRAEGEARARRKVAPRASRRAAPGKSRRFSRDWKRPCGRDSEHRWRSRSDGGSMSFDRRVPLRIPKSGMLSCNASW